MKGGPNRRAKRRQALTENQHKRAIATLNVKQLRCVAKHHGHEKVSRLRRRELVALVLPGFAMSDITIAAHTD